MFLSLNKTERPIDALLCFDKTSHFLTSISHQVQRHRLHHIPLHITLCVKYWGERKEPDFGEVADSVFWGWADILGDRWHHWRVTLSCEQASFPQAFHRNISKSDGRETGKLDKWTKRCSYPLLYVSLSSMFHTCFLFHSCRHFTLLHGDKYSYHALLNLLNLFHPNSPPSSIL